MLKTCLFCGTRISDGGTICPNCSFSSLLALPSYPYPELKHYREFLFFSFLGILLGLLACYLAYLQTESIFLVPLFVLSLTISGLILEATVGKMDALYLKVLSIVGIFISSAAYFLTIILNSSMVRAGGSSF